MEYTWRPLSTEDVPAVTALRTAAEAVDQYGWHVSEEDVAEEFADADLDFPKGSIGVRAGDQLVAYGLARIRGNAEGTHRMFLEGVVHPEHRRRGIGRELVERLIECAQAVHRNHYPADMPLVVGMIVHDRITAGGHRALADAMGFVDQRRFYTMRVSLAEEPQAPGTADGLAIVPYTRERDEDTRIARNEAFAEHWAAVAASPQVWAERYTGMKGFVPGASFLMVDTTNDAIAGFVLCQHSEVEAAVTGNRELWVADVGTVKAYRGKGIATALLRQTLAAGRAAGFDTAGLDVDSSNSTPALGVYERAGFQVASSWADYGLPVGPARG